MSWSSRDWHEQDKRYERYNGLTQNEIVSIWFPDVKESLQDGMDEYLRRRNLDGALARHFGWYPAWYNGPRIIIPCVRTDPYNFWQGRLIEGVFNFATDDFKRWDSPHGPRGDAVAYLGGLGKNLVVVEGPMDALAATLCRADAVAILGLTPPASVFLHLAKIAAGYDKITLVSDLDGIGMWTKIQHGLTKYGVLCRLVSPSPFKDLAEAPQSERERIVNQM